MESEEMTNLIELLLEQEEVYWSRRSSANWIQHGDRNTTFFHNFAMARRKKNSIQKLKDENNNWLGGMDELKPHALNLFSNFLHLKSKYRSSLVGKNSTENYSCYEGNIQYR
jgi:hypothetical protein